MYTIEKIGKETSMKMASRIECEAIMDRIYKENPEYWPHGLSISGHDGGVYMIREASTQQPVGFTGWQERKENGKKIGYYSIGILPEYRNKGFAKQAVQNLLKEKAANVDQVRALIVPSNKPSINLANTLGINIIKAANMAKPWQMVASGLGTAAALDALAYGKDAPSLKDYATKNWNVSRGTNLAINAGLGAFIPRIAMNPANPHAAEAAMLFGAGIPAKDLILTATGAIPRITHSVESTSKALEEQGNNGWSTRDKAIAGTLAGAGLAGGGILAYKLLKELKKSRELREKAQGGRVQVTLPTKSPDDRETMLDMPIDEIDLSRAQLSKLQRDARRRLRAETKERTIPRKFKLQPKEASIKGSNFTLEQLKTILFYI